MDDLPVIPGSDGVDSRKCPYCAELIKAEAKYCKHCHRRISKRAPTWRLVALILILMLVIGCYIANRSRIPEMNRQADQFARSIGTAQYEKKDWYEISHGKVVSQPLDLRGYSGWLHDPIAPSPILKVFFVPVFSSSEPERTVFAVMDSDNFERMQAGYPPLVLASSPAGQSSPVEVPYGQSFWFGFIELAGRPSAPGSIPTSSLGAAIYLLNQYQKTVHPPIRLNAEISSSVRMYATITDARREILRLRETQQ